MSEPDFDKKNQDPDADSMFDFLNEDAANKPVQRPVRAPDTDKPLPIIRKPVPISESGPLRPPRPGEPIDLGPTHQASETDEPEVDDFDFLDDQTAVPVTRTTAGPSANTRSVDDWSEAMQPNYDVADDGGSSSKRKLFFGTALIGLLVATGYFAYQDGLIPGMAKNPKDTVIDSVDNSAEDSVTNNPLAKETAAASDTDATEGGTVAANSSQSLFNLFNEQLLLIETMVSSGQFQEAEEALNSMDARVYGYGAPEFDALRVQIAEGSGGAVVAEDTAASVVEPISSDGSDASPSASESEDRAAELERLRAEIRAEERARLLEENQAQELQRQAELERVAQEAVAAERARIVEENRLADEARTLAANEQARVAEEQKLAEAEQAAEEARKAEELRVAQEARSAEEIRVAEEARQAEELRIAEEARRTEELRVAEEALRAEELRKAEEAQKAEELRLAEEARRAEELRVAEEARRAEELRVAEEARRAEELRLAEEARRAEESRVVEEARRAEELRVAEEARRAEELRVAEEAQKAEAARQLEAQREQETLAESQRAAAREQAALRAEQAAAEKLAAQNAAQREQRAAAQRATSARIAADAQRAKVEAEALARANAEAQRSKEISDDEFQQVYLRFKDLEKAIETKDINEVIALTKPSGARIQQFLQLFENSNSIVARIQNVATQNANETIIGNLEIQRVVRRDGSSVRLPARMSSIKLTSKRVASSWSLIAW